jgi:23S rRNA (cytosine1962-C5)-methyltransferase
MTKEIPVIQIKEGKESSLRRFHPWVFSGAIAGVTEMPQNGEWVKVVDSKRKFLGAGHYQEGSISVRILTFQDVESDRLFWVNKLQIAWDMRMQYQLMGPDTNMFRWVHGEGDGLPGLILDVYDQVVVVQPHTIGMEQNADSIAAAIEVVFPEVKSIYLKPSEKQLNSAPRYLKGGWVEVECKEHGIRYAVDWETGQKTGFFIDQRENRKLLGALAKGKKVLNTFCYSGGFSLTALQGGARHVDSLDSSASALELTLQNIALNQVDATRHQVIKADAVEYLKTVASDYDIIVLDPPAFAKHLSAKHKAVQGYRKINEAAIRKIQPGGLIFTFSCSQAIDKDTFKGAVMAAAIDARRPVRILYQLHQPADHPISLFHAEGEYLKGLVIQVQ